MNKLISILSFNLSNDVLRALNFNLLNVESEGR